MIKCLIGLILLLSVTDLLAFQEKVGLRKNIHLTDGLELIGEDGENYGDFTTYSRLILKTGKHEIHIKLKGSEFELDGKLYPFYRRLKNGSLEFLITINDRPFKDKLLHLIVKDNKIIQQENLPYFENSLTINDTTKNEEFKGILDFSEAFCNECDSVCYNPTLYYKFLETGIILDTLKTMIENKIEYGEFYGFKQNEKLRLKINKHR